MFTDEFLMQFKTDLISQVDAWVNLKRKFVKKKWGVEISYTFR